MKIEKLLLLFFFFAFFQSVNAQNDFDELVQERHRFYYQDKMYSRKEIGKIFERKEGANEVFQASKSIYKKANIAGLTSLGLLGIGFGAIINEIINNTCGFRSNCPMYVIVPVGLIGGCVAGTAGIAMKIDANKKMKKSVQLFNDDLDAMGMMEDARLELKMKVDFGKVGIVLNF